MKTKNSKIIVTFMVVLMLVFCCCSVIFAVTEEDQGALNYYEGVTVIEASKLGFTALNEGPNQSFQVSDERMFRDDPTYKSPPPFEPGKKSQVGVHDEMPSYVSLTTGEKVEIKEKTVYMLRTETLTSLEFAERLIADAGVTTAQAESIAEKLIEAGVQPQQYEEQIGEMYAIKVTYEKQRVKDENGNYVEKVVEVWQWPKTNLNGVYAIVASNIDGWIVTCDMHDRLYVQNGEPGLEAEGGDGYSDSNGETWINVSTSSRAYDHAVPRNVSGSMSSSVYDAPTAIPTSENLDATATADDALYHVVERHINVEAGVNARYNLSIYNYRVTCVHWIHSTTCKKHKCEQCPEGCRKEHKKGECFTKVWSGYEDVYETVNSTFYDVPESSIYPVTGASIAGAPVDGSFDIPLKGADGPGPQALQINVRNKPQINKNLSRDISSGYSINDAKADLRSEAHSNARWACENAIKNVVQGSVNYSFNGLHVTTTSSNGVAPQVGTVSGSATKMIPSTKANGQYNPVGNVTYKGKGSFGFSVSPAFVHAPVINNATINIPATFKNQSYVIDPNVKYLMLDETFSITIPNYGTHRDAKGYGTREYNTKQGVPKANTTWGKLKDIKFPFDVYYHKADGSKVLVKADTWLSTVSGISTSVDTHTFTIPVWAKEGKGVIETRVVAENAILTDPNRSKGQENANLDPTCYVATKNISVELIGKIYDMRVTNINDPGWPALKGKDGKTYIGETELPLGQAGQNPNNAYKYAPKLGYTVEFDFKTKGVKTDNVDIRIQPQGFYYVGKNGGKAEVVDLFYRTTDGKYVKIDDTTPTTPIYVNLKNAFIKVERVELMNSQRIMAKIIDTVKAYTTDIKIGNLQKLNIPLELRLTYNNFAEYINKLYGKTAVESTISRDAAGRLSYSDTYGGKVVDGKDSVIASVGHWYGRYRLPSSTIATPKGTTVAQITANPGLAKKDGYITVRFDSVGKDLANNYLRYIGPEATSTDDQLTRWENVTLPNGKPAQVPGNSLVMFETDLRANNDYESAGTH